MSRPKAERRAMKLVVGRVSEAAAAALTNLKTNRSALFEAAIWRRAAELHPLDGPDNLRQELIKGIHRIVADFPGLGGRPETVALIIALREVRSLEGELFVKASIRKYIPAAKIDGEKEEERDV